MDKRQEKKETPALLWRPLCWLVPSEWVRSVTGFWTHSSFKRGTTETIKSCHGKSGSEFTDAQNKIPKKKKNQHEDTTPQREKGQEEPRGQCVDSRGRRVWGFEGTLVHSCLGPNWLGFLFTVIYRCGCLFLPMFYTGMMKWPTQKLSRRIRTRKQNWDVRPQSKMFHPT